MGTPSAQTLVDMASEMFQEFEEVPMTTVGGLDVHRQQITFDYVDNDGSVHWGQIRPATRKTLRHWLGERCPDGDGGVALEGCTGWRYVVEELVAAGVVAHLGILPRPQPRGDQRSAPRPIVLMPGCCAPCLWRAASRVVGPARTRARDPHPGRALRVNASAPRSPRQVCRAVNGGHGPRWYRFPAR